MDIFTKLNLRKIYLYVLLIGCITFAIPLMSHIYLGTFMRFNGDEYCYLAVQSEHGFWGMQRYSYLNVGDLYNGNRYALNFMHAMLGWIGPKLPAIAPTIALSLWLLGILFALRQAKIFFNWHTESIILLFLAVSVIYFTLFITPDITQTLYWYGGMAQYLSPLILNAFLIGLVLFASRERNKAGLVVVAVTAFWSGGYSETPGIVQATYLFVFLVLAIYSIYRNDNHLARTIIPPLVTAVLASILALCLLAFAPSTTIRLSTQTHPQLPEVFLRSIRYGLGFVWQALKSMPLPYLIWFMITLIMGFIDRHLIENPPSFPLKRALKYIVLVILIGSLLTIVSMSPSVYAQNAYPGERALLSARHISIIAVAMIGWLVGRSLPVLRLPLLKRVSSTHIAIFILLFLTLYPLRAVPRIMSNQPKYQRWAAFWDERDERIRSLKDQGQLNIEVIKLDHLIHDLGELSEDPNNWYNVCAAIYYGVHSIRANQPGWDK